jgi:cell division septation protein DedD
MQEAPTETLSRTEASCPSCGAPAERGQLVCLECGGRISLDYRRPAGWKLPLAIVVAVLVAAGAAFGFGLHEITSDADTEVAKTPRGNPAPPQKPRAQAPAKKTPVGKTKATKTAGKPRPAVTTPGMPSWPAGRSGFTVVLLSSSDQAGARSFARTAKQGGTRVGVLRSNDYSSLEKGFWIVFSGVYRTRPEADRASQRLRRGFPGGFTQFVNGAKRR